MTDHKILGWKEWVRIENLGIDRIKTLIDTTQKHSSLIVSDVKEYNDNGTEMVRFKVYPQSAESDYYVKTVAKIIGKKPFKDSTGRTQMSLVITADIVLDSSSVKSELVLVEKHSAAFPLILGREAIPSGFLVNPRKSHLTGV